MVRGEAAMRGVSGVSRVFCLFRERFYLRNFRGERAGKPLKPPNPPLLAIQLSVARGWFRSLGYSTASARPERTPAPYAGTPNLARPAERYTGRLVRAPLT